MKQSKDLNWLSAPAFIFIVGILVIHSIKPVSQRRHPGKIKSENVTAQTQKPA
jgi:hypothetical protein